MRALFPAVREAVERVMPLPRLRWIAFAHLEADECGAVNEFLQAAPHAQVAHGALGCLLSLNDQCLRPPRRGPRRRGARFTARNRRRCRTWSNRPVVETADRARQFAITRAEPGGGTIRWSYRFAPDTAGTTVTLSYDVLRPESAGLHLTLRLLFGVRDLRADMQPSLRRLAEVARCEAAGRPS